MFSLTGNGHDRKESENGSAFPVGLSIRTIAPQRSSGRGPRKRSAPNANRRFSAEAQAAAADNRGPGILDYPPESMGQLAQAVALRPARHGRAMAARAVPEILGCSSCWQWDTENPKAAN